MISEIGGRAAPQSLGQFAAERIGLDAAGRLDDPALRARIGSFEVDESAFASLLARFGEQARAGQAEPAFSSALKYYGAELNKRRLGLAGAGLFTKSGQQAGEG